MSSTVPISTTRWPSNGSRPLVSVSRAKGNQAQKEAKTTKKGLLISSHMGEITSETKKIPLNSLHDARLQTELQFSCALLSASFRKLSGV
jgi:hypothetical protein